MTSARSSKIKCFHMWKMWKLVIGDAENDEVGLADGVRSGKEM